MTSKTVPESFRDLLPTLLAPAVGGYAFHEAIGAWLRSHNVFGLVFPSARRNVSVRSTDTAVTSADGWNFVLYHDTSPVEFSQLFGLQPKWLRDEDVGIRIDWSDDSVRRWSVSGAEEGERRRYDLEWQLAAGLRTPSVVWDPRFGSREY